MGYVSSLEGNWGIIPESMQTLLNLYIGILQEEMEEIKPLSRHQDWDAHSLPVIPDPFGDSKISNLVQPAKIPSWQGGYASPQINEVIKKRWPFYPRSLEIIGCHWCHFWKESRFTIQIRSQRTVRIFLVWSFLFTHSICMTNVLTFPGTWWKYLIWIWMVGSTFMISNLYMEIPWNWWKAAIYQYTVLPDTFHRTNLPNWNFLATLISCVPQNMGPNECFTVIKPIPSMYNRFTYICLIFMVNVGKYTSPMDGMGNGWGWNSMFVGSSAGEAADQTLVHFIAMQMEKRPLCKTEKNLHFVFEKKDKMTSCVLGKITNKPKTFSDWCWLKRDGTWIFAFICW